MKGFPEPEVCIQGGGPIHRQIATQVRDCILSGRLLPGEQLPTVRTLAVELAVNPDAVARAYHELECDGLLTSDEGSGTFVAQCPRRAADRQAVEELCAELLGRAAWYGYSAADVIGVLETFCQRRLS
jgi:GntR family transcriptional regulator